MRYRLLFVARRVLIWIEPLLYRTLHFDKASKFPSFPTKPPHFFATHTRHVVLQSMQDQCRNSELLKLCTGVTHVSLSTLTPLDFHDFLYALRQIQYLACHSDEFALPGSIMGGQAATLPVFASLTHLELFDYEFHPLLVDFCACLPALTHLALNANNLGEDGWTRRETLLLQRWTSLKLLVLLAESLDHAEFLADNVPSSLSDVRFVITTWSEDWTEGASDCYSYWDVADFVAQKRRGLIKDSVFLAQRH
ncbi:hypothetical protein C8F01DRAFT_1144889 [Mycena amicta]|nr:hypothetical protein C8F01DRAFT_1144889 [Mycena amicta]